MITHRDEFAQMGLTWHQWQSFNPDPSSHVDQCEQVVEWWESLPELDRAEYVLTNHGYHQDYLVAHEYLTHLDTHLAALDRIQGLDNFNAYIQEVQSRFPG